MSQWEIQVNIQKLKGDYDHVRQTAAEALGKIGSSFSLPRKILSNHSLSAQDKLETLAKLRRIRYKDNAIALQYKFEETAQLCRNILDEDDEEARKGAQTVLDWLNGDRHLLMASQKDDSKDADVYLRAYEGSLPDPHPESLLRASGESGSEVENSSKPPNWLERQMEKLKNMH